MAKERKYYVVWAGRKTGIFETWQACKEQVEGYAQARYKAFEDRQMAEQMFRLGYEYYTNQKTPNQNITEQRKEKVRKIIGEPILESISVDAACAGNPGELEYRGVYSLNQGVLFHLKFPLGTNNIGEFLAIVHALAYLQKLAKDTPIYSDSRTAIQWVKNKKAKTKLPKTPQTERLFELITRAENWLENHTYPNKILKWATEYWGEIPADFGRK
jgi:ribonuclease HI